MRRVTLCVLMVSLVVSGSAFAGPFDDLLKGVKLPGIGKAGEPDTNTTIAGLKEALSIGTGNAVTSSSKLDGYFGNQLIKILLPDNIQKVADVLAKVGYRKEVDAFILSMNRAAENAAPRAKEIFLGAIREMTFDDARKILTGGDTAATQYFKGKTSGSLYESFKPIISTSMNKVGVTKSYKDMMGKYDSLPFVQKESLDLDHYVTNKALDGLFILVGEEEKKIRTNPAARVTDLLRTVFGK
jgi:hypothetical protein